VITPARRHRSRPLRPILVALAVGFLGVIVVGSFTQKLQRAFHISIPIEETLWQAQHSPPLIAALGEPIEAGWWIHGDLSTNGVGDSGSAEFLLPMHGPKGNATARIVAKLDRRKTMAAQWFFDPVPVTVDGVRTVTLTIPARCQTGTCSSHAYVAALRIVRADDRITARLGEPIQDDPARVIGNLSVSVDTGHTDFDALIEGPKGEAYMIGKGTWTGRHWSLDSLKVLFPVREATGNWNRASSSATTLGLVPPSPGGDRR